MKKALIITHYQKEDKKFEGDYSSVILFIDGKLVEEWTDEYHESGKATAESFVQGVKYVCPDLKVEEKSIADMEY